jgi:Na+-driven multidrug efflux pump
MFSYPIALFNTFTCSVMNANGDTKRPTIATITSGFVNVVFNFLFVLGFNMDIAGLAWATFLSHATDTVILVWIMFSPKDNYKVKLSEFRLQKEHLQKILSVGFPASINSMAFTISGMLLQSSINSFGEAVVAGNTAASSCYSYVHHVLSGFCSACLCATAQCYGAHNLERIKYVVKKAISSALILCLGMATIITIFVRPLLSLFTDELAVIEAGIQIVMFNCWGFVLLTFGDMYAAALKGIRKSSLAMIISLLSVCVPRVVWVLAILPLNNTPIMLYCVYPVSWLITAIFMAIAYRKQFKQLSFATI